MPPRPPLQLVVVNVLLMVWAELLLAIVLAATRDVSSFTREILPAIVALGIPIALAMVSYLATFCRHSLSAAVLSGVGWFVMILATGLLVSAVAIVPDYDVGRRAFGLLVMGAVVGFVNLQWRMTLASWRVDQGESGDRLIPQFSLRDLMWLTLHVGMILGASRLL